jgi:hypothetical protein
LDDDVACDELGVIGCEATALVYRRYDFMLRDFEYCLNIEGVASRHARSSRLLRRWMGVLTYVQLADPQVRELHTQVELEHHAWLQAFHLHLSLSGAFGAVLKPLTDLLPPLDLAGAAAAQAIAVTPANVLPPPSLLSPEAWQAARRDAAAIGDAALCALCRWLSRSDLLLTRTEVTLPAALGGGTAIFFALGVHEALSFHIPLHRFLAATVREAAFLDTSAAGALLSAPLHAFWAAKDAATVVLRRHLDAYLGDGPMVVECEGPLRLHSTYTRMLWWLLEYPARVLVLAAQVVAGMWRRNGAIMLHQVTNYATTPLCRLRLRDMDLLLIQTCLGWLLAPEAAAAEAAKTAADTLAAETEAAVVAAAREASCAGQDENLWMEDTRIPEDDEHEAPSPARERFYVVYSGRAIGVVTETSASTRFYDGSDAPLFEEYNTLEAAQKAWADRVPAPPADVAQAPAPAHKAQPALSRAAAVASRLLVSLALKMGIASWPLEACGTLSTPFGPSSEVQKAFDWTQDGALEATLDTEKRLSLSEELMVILIHLTTEMPRPAGAAGVAAELRREMIHRLAAQQPCTRSELCECLDACSHPKLVRASGEGRGHLEVVLASVAQRVPPPSSAPALGAPSRAPRLVLRPEVAAELDPEFYHASAVQLKAIAERRAAATTAKPGANLPTPPPPMPVVGPPPQAHPFFAGVRTALLFAPPAVAMVRSALARSLLISMAGPAASNEAAVRAAAASASLGAIVRAAALHTAARHTAARHTAGCKVEPLWLPDWWGLEDLEAREKMKTARFDWAKDSLEAAHQQGSERLLARALHLLTLMVHEATRQAVHEQVGCEVAMEQGAADATTSAEARDKMADDEASATFFHLLCERVETEGTVVAEVTEGAERGHYPLERTPQMCNVLELVRALSLALESGPLRAGCEWVLSTALSTSPECRACLERLESVESDERAVRGVVATPPDALGGTNAASRLERKKKAQQRLMEQMRQQSAKFSQFLEGDAEASGPGGGGSGGGGGPGSADGPSVAPAVAAADTEGSDASSAGGRPPAYGRFPAKLPSPSSQLEQAEVKEVLCGAPWPALPTCIICHTEDANPIGYICCTQPSNVLTDASCLPPPSVTSADPPLEPPLPPKAAFLQFCGHAVHTECLHKHKAALEQKQRSGTHFEGKAALRLERGEFLCPMCKRLSNGVLPIFSLEARERVLAAQVFERERCSSHFALTVHASEQGALEPQWGALPTHPHTMTNSTRRLRRLLQPDMAAEDLRCSWPGFTIDELLAKDQIVLEDADACLDTRDQVCHPCKNSDASAFLATLEAAEGNLALGPSTLSGEALVEARMWEAVWLLPSAPELMTAWWLRQLLLHQYACAGQSAVAAAALSSPPILRGIVLAPPGPILDSSSNGSPVREWLLHQAAVHPCFADQVLAVLEAEEVLSLDDLRLLAGHPHFDSCGLPVLTVLQIRKALASQQPQSQSQQSPLALAPQRLALPWYRPPALPTSNERALHMSNERALGVDDDSAASATTAAQIESDLSWGEADDCLVDWLEANSDNYAALRASALTRSQGAVSLHEAAAAAQAAWGGPLRPTPPRLGAIAAFALGVHHTRTGVAVGAPWPVDEHDGYRELLGALSYTILSRVALAALVATEEQDGSAMAAAATSNASVSASASASGRGGDGVAGCEACEAGGGSHVSTSSLRVTASQVALESELRASAPMRAMVHACRLSQLHGLHASKDTGKIACDPRRRAARWPTTEGQCSPARELLRHGMPVKEATAAAVAAAKAEAEMAQTVGAQAMAEVEAEVAARAEALRNQQGALSAAVEAAKAKLAAAIEAGVEARQFRCGTELCLGALSAYALPRSGPYALPLLHQNLFEAILPALLEAHALSEVWCVLRLGALAVMVQALYISAMQSATLATGTAESEAEAATGAAEGAEQAAADAADLTRKHSLDIEVACAVSGSDWDRAEARSLRALCAAMKIDLGSVKIDLGSPSGGHVSDSAILYARIQAALGSYYCQARAICALLGAEMPPSRPIPYGGGRQCTAALAVLGAPSPLDVLESPRLTSLAASWVSAVSRCAIEGGGRTSLQRVLPRWHPSARALFPLPDRFTDLYQSLNGCVCPQTGQPREDLALCLLCGAVLCAGTGCCKRHGQGALTRHVSECGAHVGIFFLLHRCATVLLRGPHAAYGLSPYVDEYGEEDPGLRRGRPLLLDQTRLAQLHRIWASHSIAGEVVRERSMRDRAVREGFY